MNYQRAGKMRLTIFARMTVLLFIVKAGVFTTASAQQKWPEPRTDRQLQYQQIVIRWIMTEPGQTDCKTEHCSMMYFYQYRYHPTAGEESNEQSLWRTNKIYYKNGMQGDGTCIIQR